MRMGARALVLVVGVLLFAAAPVRAGFAPVFTGLGAPGATRDFNYSVVFSTTSVSGTPIERIDAGSGVIAPGVQGSQDFVTIFDIPGFVNATAPAGFSVQTQLLGIAGPFQAPPDDLALTNVTFRYTGADVSTDTVFIGFTIVSTFQFTNSPTGFYSSQRTDNLGLDGGQKVGETGHVAVPIVPEPSTTAALLALISTPLLARKRR